MVKLNFMLSSVLKVVEGVRMTFDQEGTSGVLVITIPDGDLIKEGLRVGEVFTVSVEPKKK